MRSPRLLIEAELATGSRLELTPETLRHAVSVLRLRDGAACRVFNGRGAEYHATLSLAGRRSGAAVLTGVAAAPTNPALPLRLLQGIARGDHMDLAVQKAVELGVTEIWPILCQRSLSGAGHRRLDNRLQHWQGVLRAAAEQCGRNELPRLDPPRDLAAALTDLPQPGLRVVADPDGAPPALWRSLRPQADPGTLSLLVGPEGGLEATETAQARSAGFLGLRLGPRVLRTETASIVGLTALQMLYGDLA
ncbi:16S rRNA (uracil(1498)-N(3))-methyltransferase [Thioalkalivibrio sp.]|uniref:16S rRNA (uracil(1498)-N(3))-methyltransferase n=1 Tax=Thioalkalivibrio sp. TaxID=2093813 RepID=UPI00397536A6